MGMWARVGLHTAISTNLTVTVYDNVYGTGQDMIDINGFVPVVDGTTYREGALAINMVTALGDPDVFTSLALPRTLDAKLFQAQRFALLQSDGAEGGMIYQFSIDSIRRVPSIWGLLPNMP